MAAPRCAAGQSRFRARRRLSFADLNGDQARGSVKHARVKKFSRESGNKISVRRFRHVDLPAAELSPHDEQPS